VRFILNLENFRVLFNGKRRKFLLKQRIKGLHVVGGKKRK